MKCGIKIGGYNGITENKSLETDFEYLAQLGVDEIYMTVFHNDEPVNRFNLSMLEKYGIKAYINDYELNGKLLNGISDEEFHILYSRYCTSSCYLGNFLVDEPSRCDFLRYGNIIDEFHRHTPKANIYVNFLPEYAFSSAREFECYISEGCKMLDIPMLSIDSYPINIINGKKVVNSTLFITLDFIAKKSEDVKRSHEEYLYVMYDEINPNYNYLPSLTDLRFQAYTYLAYGAKKLVLYCVDTPPCAVGSPNFGLVKNHEKTVLFDTVKILLDEIDGLYTLDGFQWQRCEICEPDMPNSVNIKSNDRLLAGIFKKECQLRLMVVNLCDLNEPKQAYFTYNGRHYTIEECGAVIV